MTVQALRIHVAINVRDLAKSIEFYRNLFDLEPAKVRTGYAKFDVANPRSTSPLTSVPLTRPAHSHISESR